MRVTFAATSATSTGTVPTSGATWLRVTLRMRHGTARTCATMSRTFKKTGAIFAKINATLTTTAGMCALTAVTQGRMRVIFVRTAETFITTATGSSNRDSDRRRETCRLFHLAKGVVGQST